MIHITNKTNFDQQAHFMNKLGPGVTSIDVNQQVNDQITTHVGDGVHFMANTIQTSSNG